MQVATDVDRPVLTLVYEVTGRFLIFESSCVETAHAIQQFLARWELVQHTRQIQRLQNTTIVFRLGDLPETAGSSTSFDLGEGVSAFTNDSGYTIRFPNALVAVDHSNIVRVWSREPLGPADPWLAQIVSHSLSAALRRSDVFELHSAAVVNHDSSKALLICGPSGSGKSTLTLQLVASGWRYLSDDVVLLAADEERVRVSGLRRFFALTERTIECSGLSQVSDRLSRKSSDPPVKRAFQPQELFPCQALNVCYPDTIFFPVVSDREKSLTRALNDGESMARLIRLCPWSCYDLAVARRFLDVLATLVKQSMSLDLLAGRDLLGDSAYTDRFFNQALANPAQ